MTHPELLDEIDTLAFQARAIVQGLAFAMNAEEGEPTRDIVQGMLASVTDMLDSLMEAVEDITV